MVVIDDIEPIRLVLQDQLDSAKSQAERNKLGQFATPTALATDILTFAKLLIPFDEQIRFLDPAIGTGSFYSALLRSFSDSPIASAVGYEIDPFHGGKAADLWAGTPLQLHIADFTRATPPLSTAERANLLICNPPYVRHHHLTGDEKSRLHKLSWEATEIDVSGLAGLYCYFLCIAHGWLAEGGLAGWLIPSEFMDVNYGRQIKEYLLSRVTLLRIHRFSPTEVQFDDALVSSAVVWFRKLPPPVDHTVEFSYGGSLSQPVEVKRIPANVLRSTAKWSRFPQGSADRKAAHSQRLILSDLFKIQRGIATGANEYFILTPEQVALHNLPADHLTPILPSPRYLTADAIDADSEGRPTLERKLLLLRCDLPEGEIQDRYPALWKYLQTGIDSGVRDRYLCRHRSPWYTQENRPPAPLLCTYMGRQDAGCGRPFRFILNHSEATAPNVYLMLYPKPLLRQCVQGRPDRLTAVWQALNGISPQTLIGEGRVYGGGLYKLEPRELGNAPADEILAVLPEIGGAYVAQQRLFDE